MKKTVLLLIIALISVTSFSQERKYNRSMQKAFEMLNEASQPAAYIETAAEFEKIATKFEDRWLPGYYAAHALIIGSLEETDAAASDALLERSKKSLDRAKELESGESEIAVLSAFHILAQMAVDPETRGPAYYEDFSAQLENAKRLNPDNPRVYYLQGLLMANVPDFMGGGPDAARSAYETAMVKYKAFMHEDPFWPIWGEDLVQEELNRLSGQ